MIYYSLPFSIYSELFVEIHQLRPTPLAIGTSVEVTPFEFRKDFWNQKQTRSPAVAEEPPEAGVQVEMSMSIVDL